MTEEHSQRTVDLHTHTTASDGDLSPTELVARAHAAGLTAIAVTDHDTTAGLHEALEAGKRIGLEVVPGIELSAEVGRGQCHLLGFLIDPDNEPLLSRLRYVVDMRNNRNSHIIDRLRNELGFDITLDEVEVIAGGDIVARPHFARVMVNKGYVSSMQEAFDIFLGKGGRAYVERVRLSPPEAIALIHGAGGVAVLAHPNNLQRGETETEVLKQDTIGIPRRIPLVISLSLPGWVFSHPGDPTITARVSNRVSYLARLRASSRRPFLSWTG